MSEDRSMLTSAGPDGTPRCPFCGSVQVELLSLFGSQLLTEQWYCRACHTPFEHVKDRDRGGPGLLPQGALDANGRSS